jgi:murein DD-endopeptidase MepM/ murein hydrolase activator NlpD
MVRPFYAIERHLMRHRQRRNPQRKTRRLFWSVLIIALIILNGYLIFVRDLPGYREDNQYQNSISSVSSARQLPHGVFSMHGRYLARLGEIRGVAGIRNMDTLNLKPMPHNSNLRFDFTESRQLAGQRTVEQWSQRVEGTIGKNDSFASALERYGIDKQQVFSLVTGLKGLVQFRYCRAGEKFEFLRTPTGSIERLIYKKSPLVSYRVERIQGKYIGRRVDLKVETRLVPISLRIQGSLYASLERIGESPALVMGIVDIFAWDIDFFIDTRPDDLVRILVEKHFLDDAPVGYGRIIAAEYNGGVGRHLAFWYQTEDQKIAYYDQDGNSMQKAFLKSPLKFSRISSSFGMRVHPVLGFSKMHMGIDLAAPTGTPIWAPADGTVIYSGRKGISGKLVVLRHPLGYETVYAHLHSIDSAVRRGARVRQKQAIGTVGSTGRSTGPHLHYGMKLRGRHINPFKQKFPPAKPVPTAELEAYKSKITPFMKMLEEATITPKTQTASVPGSVKGAG